MGDLLWVVPTESEVLVCVSEEETCALLSFTKAGDFVGKKYSGSLLVDGGYLLLNSCLILLCGGLYFANSPPFSVAFTEGKKVTVATETDVQEWDTE